MTEQEEIIEIFSAMLAGPTGDGRNKRERGEKPLWKVDDSHERALWSHLRKWVTGRKWDEDSGSHALVHAAWRCLAIAWQESQDAEMEWRDDPNMGDVNERQRNARIAAGE